MSGGRCWSCSCLLHCLASSMAAFGAFNGARAGRGVEATDSISSRRSIQDGLCLICAQQ